MNILERKEDKLSYLRSFVFSCTVIVSRWENFVLTVIVQIATTIWNLKRRDNGQLDNAWIEIQMLSVQRLVKILHRKIGGITKGVIAKDQVHIRCRSFHSPALEEY